MPKKFGKGIVVTRNQYPLTRFKTRYKGGGRARLEPGIEVRVSGSQANLAQIIKRLETRRLTAKRQLDTLVDGNPLWEDKFSADTLGRFNKSVWCLPA